MKVQNRKLLLRNNSVAILPKCRDTMGLLKKDRRIRLKDFTLQSRGYENSLAIKLKYGYNKGLLGGIWEDLSI